MIEFLAKCFIKNHADKQDSSVRQGYGVLCGSVGIALNLLLFAFKFFAGLLTNSVAITADAFNNRSDAGTSVVTLFGFKLAGQKPDVEHPFGHGRFEYISGLLVSIAIVLMGFELLKESLAKIFAPAPIAFSTLATVILLASIAVKFYMFLYNRAVGRAIGSGAMLATATDSLSDCAATSAVLAATLIGERTGLALDGWCGAAVALLIFVAGFKAAKETISPLLGQPPAPEFVARIEEIVMSSAAVCGIHDLIVHDYGPGRVMVSLHAEVSADGNLLEIHDEIDNVEQQLRRELGCLATIHMDPIVTDDTRTNETRERVAALVKLIDPRISIHDFRMVAGPTHTNVIFDAVVPYGFPLSDREVEERICDGVRALDGNFFAVVQIDKTYV